LALDVVTGALGYIGRYITAQLLESGREVRTITSHTNKPNPFGDDLEVYSYDFDQPERLVNSLRGAETLYNTYWIRFEHGGLTFADAVENTRILFESAVKAGVKKIVHISVTQASLESPLAYYRGKALQEQLLTSGVVPYCIVRPTLVFGKEDILVNNIAWLMRKFPIFPIFGNGKYRIQPVYVGDLASIAIEGDGLVIDAIGPEEYTFDAFVRLIADALNSRTWFLRVPPAMGITLGKILGWWRGDVILTRAELQGLMDNLLTSNQAPNGRTKFSEWVRENAATVGASYTSELARHFRWKD
jgi:NADH dehydrogenase